jgi:DNA-binding beta-propeller fold protein YncE
MGKALAARCGSGQHRADADNGTGSRRGQGEERMRLSRLAGCAIAAAVAVIALGGVARAQLMIVGNDEKPHFADGKTTMGEGGHDTLSVIDTSKPGNLRIVATIPLDNSIIGPPTNLAITPKGDLALVANSVNDQKKDDGTYAPVSDDRVFVIDLKASPPAVVDTLHAGKRPSGMAINAAGTMALVTNRDDGTISVLAINGREVKVTDTVTVGAAGDSVSAVAIAPDGKRALFTKPAANKIGVLAIDGDKVSYNKQDLPTGIFPYNVVIAPNGKLAMTVDNGNGGGSDGNVDTASVIDLEANPIRVIDHITVGDSPEGLAISPRGNLAVTVEARGSNQPKTSWFSHPNGAVSVLRIDGKKVTRVGEVAVGALPEAVAFSADGSHIYVGNFIESDITVLSVMGDKVRDTGPRFKLPGHPASARGGPQ